MTRRSDVVDFDADAAVEGFHDAVGDDLLVVTEYDRERLRILYAAERVLSLYEDEGAMQEHFEQIHTYVYLDFIERDLFEDLFIDTGGVQAFATHMGNFIAVRILADMEGLFVVLVPDANPTRVVESARETI